MALKDLFTMAKSDRYTQDGRDQLIKAQEVETEDRRYKNGEISEKTGLMKTPKGWVEPPKGGRTPKGNNSGMSKHWVQKGEKADFIERTPQEEKAMWEKVAARQSDDKLKLAIKNREGRELSPVEKIKLETAKEELAKRGGSKSDGITNSEGKSGSAEKHAKAMENAKKVGIVSKVPEGWKKAEGVTTAPNGYVAITNGGSHFPKEGQQKKEIKFIKEEDFNKGNTQSALSGLSGPRESSNGWITSSNGDRMQVSEAQNKIQSNQQKIDSLKKEMEGKSKADNFRAGAELKRLENENEYLKERVPAAPKPSVQEYMKAQDTVKKYDETYKKQLEEYENGQRLRANGGGAILDPMYGLKPNDLSKNADYMKAKDIIQRMEAEDAAPRVLTGDTRIRIRK